MNRAISDSSIIQNRTVTCSNVCILVFLWIVGAFFVGLSYVSISLNPQNTTYEEVDYGFSIVCVIMGFLSLLAGFILFGIMIARCVNSRHQVDHVEVVNPYENNNSFSYGTYKEGDYDDL